MSDATRLDAPFGCLLDRSKPVTFEFDGRQYKGFAGDTVASALAANGVFVVSRSFKYHRPRGVLTMAGQDANTLVQLPANPNALADREPIAEGLEVSAQNVSGSLARDRGAWIAPFSRFLPVAFYYKAFYRPRGIWNLWSRLFRKRTGLGVIDQTHVSRGYDKQYRFCDVAVVGGGPAGLSAALAAAETGARVLLVDENPTLGGALNYMRPDNTEPPVGQRLAALVDAARSHPAIEVMTGATVNGWYADNWLPVIQRKRLYKLRAQQLILAPGTLEQPAIFRNNDLPGVMMGSAAQRLMRLYGVRPGRRAVVLTANREGYAVAMDLFDAGVVVAAVVDLRADGCAGNLSRRLAELDVPILTGQTVFAAYTAGRHRVAGVDVRRIVDRGVCAKDGKKIVCDLLCMSVGFMPAWQLACMAGGRLDYEDQSAAFCISGLPGNVHLAGSVNGLRTAADVVTDARRAAAAACGQPTVDDVDAVGQAGAGASGNAPWPIFPHPDGKEFVDLDEDLTLGDIVNATRDGYEHVQLVKRYSTCGMGPSQGRHSALATARLVADATGMTVSETGVTTARPPFAAERLAHCAGRSFHPARRSNMHHRHVEAGAQMLIAGDWYRPAYYGQPQSRDQCIRAEASVVRSAVGLVDVSTLGGIEIRGADAGEFMNRIYTMAFKKLEVGRSRYALMTNEAGVVIDDGVACRLGDEHYYVTATTGGVARVFQTMLKWNAQWRLDVDLANVTSAFCAVNIAGPCARRVLERVCTDVDLSAGAFPYMGVREGHVAGTPARLIRVGFVGELGFEVHVPQHAGEALWDAMMQAGAADAIRPFGVEAQRLLRLEKGHVIIGQDTDAMSNPLELDMGWAIARKKPYFVGGRTLDVLQKRALTRRLAGFVIDDPASPVPAESHLIIDGERMVGRVTSAAFSVALGRPIGLAYVPPESAAPGSRIAIRCDGGVIVDARTVELPFYDSGNERQSL